MGLFIFQVSGMTAGTCGIIAGIFNCEFAWAALGILYAVAVGFIGLGIDWWERRCVTK